MTPAETLTLAAYFFVLIILAVYGWHRYYLVYLYMRNRDKDPRPVAPLTPLPVVTIQLPLYNEMYVADRLIDAVCGIDYPRELLEIQVLDDSIDETRGIAESAVRRFAAAGRRHPLHSPRRPDRLQGRGARGRAEGRARRVRRHLRRRFHPAARLPHAADAAFRRSQGRDGAGALGPHQPGLFAPDEDPVDSARRPLRARAWRPASRRDGSSISTARPASGGGRRSRTPAAGSTTR